jgi:hypothetical protein
MTTNQQLYLDRDGLRVGDNQIQTLGGGVGIGTSSIYGSLTVGNTAVFYGNVGINTNNPTYTLTVNGTLNATNFQTDPSGAIMGFTKTISSPYTIPTGYNALSVGALTINQGANVTVQPGTRWVIL